MSNISESDSESIEESVVQDNSNAGETAVDPSSEAAREEQGLHIREEQMTLPLAAGISALLFSTSKPMTLAQFMKITKRSEGEVEFALAELRGMFVDEFHGFALHEVAGGFQFRTAPGAAPWVRELAPKKTKRLSRAAAETLAVIAYKQPVQRAEIEAVRGVDALPTLKTLLDLKLIRIVGQDESIGHPALYGTTDLFLERFGLSSLDALPTERQLEEIELDAGEPDELEADETSGDYDLRLNPESSNSAENSEGETLQ